MTHLSSLSGTLLLLLLLASTARAVSREFNEIFAVQPGCTVNLDTTRGRIVIDEADAPEVRVRLLLGFDAASEAAAERAAARVTRIVRQEGNVVHVQVLDSPTRFVWQKEVECHFQITVPRHCNLQIRARQGSVVVGNLRGAVSVRLDAGPIFLRRIDGSVDVSTGTGDITVSRCSGAVRARVTLGTVQLGTIGGHVDVRNSRGDVEVLTARAGANVVADAGSVVIGFGPGLPTASRVAVQAGDVVARLSPQLGCTVHASSVWGRVHSSGPFAREEGASGTRRLVAAFNGGGPALKLHANGGNVRISPDAVLIDAPVPQSAG